MLKLTPLAIALLTVISIAPKSQALTTTDRPASLQQPAGNLHAQVIIKIGTQTESRHEEIERYRRAELEREREAAWRRRHRYYSHRHNNYEYRGESNNRGEYNNNSRSGSSYERYERYERR
jgi:hypothetical protein